ncbi:MAG: hypothetical protein J0M07_22650 [Anaerolineae bacterium]|nr:hypothetical protein [Anaerolineae bacterium]
MVRVFMFVVVILALTACDSDVDLRSPMNAVTTPSPQSTPETDSEVLVPAQDFPGVVTGLDMRNNQIYLVADEICVYLRQAPLWEPGDYWNGFDTLPSVMISVDQEQVTELERFVSGVLEFEVDESGNEVGTHGYSMDFCFSPLAIRGIQAGSHTIAISIVKISGKTYSYSWVFNII